MSNFKLIYSMAAVSIKRSVLPSGLLCMCWLGLLTGCQLNRGLLTESPLTYRQQVEEIQKIVPAGMPRDEAVAKLEQAGIKGSFGENKSVYYCGVWNRGEGQIWRIEVALLFDEQGNYLSSSPGELSAGDAASALAEQNAIHAKSENSPEVKPVSARAEQRARTAALLEDSSK